MTPGFAFFTFLNAFCVMLFIAVPFSTRYEKHEHYAAAPSQIRWRKAFIIAALLAFAITLGLALVIKSGIVPVRNIN